LLTHDFDGEITGVLNQTVGAGRCHKKGFERLGSGGVIKILYNQWLCCKFRKNMESPAKASLVAKKSTQTADEATLEVDETEDFRPMTAQEAQAWRASQPTLSVWKVVGVQLMLALVLALSAIWIWGRSSIAFSLMYGAFAVVVPSALFARGMTSRLSSVNAVSAVLGFAVWQGVKMVLTVLLLALAPSVLNEVSWPALLVGLLLTMNVYWLALAWGKPRQATPQD
jgi:ATP synthase protein I